MSTTRFYNTSEQIDIYELLTSWMGSVPDSRQLDTLSIPGTHGSMTYYGGDAYQCQTLSVKKQLHSGIRFLDISCKVEEDRLSIYQWNCYQRASVADVFVNILEFLDSKKTECVILKLALEKDQIQEGKTILNKYLEIFGKQHFWLEDGIPSMEEARGKIVLLKTFSEEERGIGCDNIDLFQDEHVPTLFHISQLWENAKEHLQYVIYCPKKLFVTYCCGSSWFAYPYSVAYDINQKLLDFLENENLNAWGIIALDYPGMDLVEEIINSNNFDK